MKRQVSVFMGAFLFMMLVSAYSVVFYPMAINVNVAYENGSIVDGANVTVTCGGVDFSGKSDSVGEFVAGFESESCDYDIKGDFGSYYGTQSGSCSSGVDFTVADAVIIGTISCDADLVLNNKYVDFYGVIYNTTNGGDVVAGADVGVVCDGVLLNTTSDSLGEYVVSFLESDCENGDGYSVYAVSGDSEGTESGVVADAVEGVNVDVVIVKADEPVEEVSILFRGVVYNVTLSGEVVQSAVVRVTCNGVVNETLSDENGSYSVSFLESVCSGYDLFSIKGIKGKYSESLNGLNVSDGTIIDLVLNYVAPVVVAKSSGGGGSAAACATRWTCDEWSECSSA